MLPTERVEIPEPTSREPLAAAPARFGRPLGRRLAGHLATFTRSVCRERRSTRGLDGGRATLFAMDIVSVVLGLLMFAILIAIIEGIDRI